MATRLGWLGLWLLCGCFDHGDGVAAGSGAEGGSSGMGGTGGFPFGGNSGGFSGIGGSSFDGGFGGFGGGLPPNPCPFEDPNCSDELRMDVCEDLIECATVAGPLPRLEDCMAAIDTRCVQCVRALGADAADGGVADDGGASELAACDASFEGSECDDFCDLLVQPPLSTFECEALAKGELAEAPLDAQCMCGNCFFELEQCMLDDGCWLISQCAERVGCTGMACFTGQTCAPLFGTAGVTSMSGSLFTQFHDCSNVFCDTLND